MPHVYDLVRTKHHPTTFPSPWHQDVTSRFAGVFEPALMEKVLEHAQHMLVPEGTMLMDVGQQMEAIPLLVMRHQNHKARPRRR